MYKTLFALYSHCSIFKHSDKKLSLVGPAAKNSQVSHCTKICNIDSCGLTSKVIFFGHKAQLFSNIDKMTDPLYFPTNRVKEESDMEEELLTEIYLPQSSESAAS